jgi:DNA-binding beta-propeller fold protein YncE
MTLNLIGHVDLPAHTGQGGFDHAAVHAATGHVYVAHTANDAIDVLDANRHLFSIPNLPGVAGALVSDEAQLIFSSNRAENTVGIFAPGPDPQVTKINVGVGPNGLAYDHGTRLLLAANVGNPQIAGSHTVTIVDVAGATGVDVAGATVRASIPVPGRTRWTVFDPASGLFYVNILNPAVIAVIDRKRPDALAFMYAVPAAGPHGLDFDPDTRRLFCACDAGRLITLDAATGRILHDAPLSGVPDVIFFNRGLRQLYVAVGDPGDVEVFDTRTMKSLGRIATEKGAHTTALTPAGDLLYVFLPQTHRAAVYRLGEA